jgi:hypothetical protein
VRQNVDPTTPLFLTCDEPGRLHVPSGQLAAQNHVDVHLRAARSVQQMADGPTAMVYAHLFSPSGPLIRRLRVMVFSPIEVNVVFHRVVGGGGQAPTLNVPQLARMAQAVWLQAGLKLLIGTGTGPFRAIVDLGRHDLEAAIRNDTVAWADGRLRVGADTSPLLGMLANNVHPAINIYVVHTYDKENAPNTSGDGWSWASAQRLVGQGVVGMKPAIVVGERSGNGNQFGENVVGNTIAHEIGHFFDLQHPGDPAHTNPPTDSAERDKARQEIFARRLIMHPSNPMSHVGGDLSFLNDIVGYGQWRNKAIRGALVTQRAIGGNYISLATDNHAVNVRNRVFHGTPWVYGNP